MKKLGLALIACAVICAVALLVTKLSENSIIIYMGARNYTYISTSIIVIAILFAITAIVCFFIHPKKVTKVGTSFSSDNGYTKFERYSIKKEIVENAEGKWLILNSELAYILGGLTRCDEYYDNICNLLESDRNSIVSGAEELLGRLRDCAYRNVEKLLNYMKALSSADSLRVNAKTTQCYEINSKLVDDASNFTEAVVNHINNSFDKDEEQRSLLLIESYKEVILGVIDDDAKLLQ